MCRYCLLLVIHAFFTLIAPRHIVSINSTITDHETVIIGQFDVKHIMMLPIDTVRSVWKVLTYNITSITTSSIRLSVILRIMSVLSFKIDDTLCMLQSYLGIITFV